MRIELHNITVYFSISFISLVVNDDIQQYSSKWSLGEINHGDVTSGGSDTQLDPSPRGPLPDSRTTNSISFSMGARPTSGSLDAVSIVCRSSSSMTYPGCIFYILIWNCYLQQHLLFSSHSHSLPVISDFLSSFFFLMCMCVSY